MFSLKTHETPRNWLFLTLSNDDTEFCPAFSWLHCKDNLKSQYNFFGRNFVTVFFDEILDMQIIHEKAYCKWESLFSNHSLRTLKTVQFQLSPNVICYKICILIDTHYACSVMSHVVLLVYQTMLIISTRKSSKRVTSYAVSLSDLCNAKHISWFKISYNRNQWL